MKWYYERGAGQEGPVSLSVLQAMLTSGDLEPHHKVWSKGLADWTPAGEVDALSAGPEQEVAEESGPSELEAAMANLAAATSGDDANNVSSSEGAATEAYEEESIEMPHIELVDDELSDEEVEKLNEFVEYRLARGQDLDELAAEIANATPLSEAGALGFADAVQYWMAGPPEIAGDEPDDDEAKLLAEFVTKRLAQGKDAGAIVAEIVDATSVDEDYVFGFVNAIDSAEEESEIGCLGWLGILWVCGMIFSGCMRLCSG